MKKLVLLAVCVFVASVSAGMSLSFVNVILALKSIFKSKLNLKMYFSLQAHWANTARHQTTKMVSESFM